MVILDGLRVILCRSRLALWLKRDGFVIFLHRIVYGEGIERSDIKAVEYYKKAIKYFEKDCDQGNGYACSFVGGRYEYGDGVELNKTIAGRYYQKAITYHKKPVILVMWMHVYFSRILMKTDWE